MVKKYLVTGASGYIAMHVIDQLIKQGHSVRGTIRSLKDKEKVDAIKKLGPVELVEGDLEDPESWKRAVKGIDIVLHVASPVPAGSLMDENVIIKQAVDGTVNVLNAAYAEGIKRVVVTSSGITLSEDLAIKNRSYSELNWGDLSLIPNTQQTGYQRSKILAERAAWDFYEKHKKDGFKLSTVLPVLTIGPVLSSINKSSVSFFYPGFDKSLEKVSTIIAPVCDVRDVALAHLRAAQLDEAVGQRFLITTDDQNYSTGEIFKIIEKEGKYELNKNIEEKTNRDEYKTVRFDNSKMRKVLKIKPTDLKKSALDMAQSFLKYGIVKK